MSYELEADYHQEYMFPPRLEELLGSTHPARFIREFVSELNLSELGFKVGDVDRQGRPRYSLSLLLRVWLYGYYSKVRSTRGLEQACHERLPFMWLSGMHRRDHNTLHRFFKENKSALKSLFKQTVKVACKLELVDFVYQAVDGSKIASSARWRGSFDEASLKELLSKADKRIAELEKELEQCNEREPSELPAQLSHASELKQKVCEALGEVRDSDCKYKHPEDIQANRMQCQGRNRFAYNAQVMADSKEQIIVANEVSNEPTDYNHLASSIEQAQQNCGKQADAYLADSGYSSAENFEQTKDSNVIAPIPPSTKKAEQDPYGAPNFAYDKKADVMICPQGQKLPFRRINNDNGDNRRVYENYAACKKCSVRSQCTKGRYKRITVCENHEYLRAHSKKMKRSENRDHYRKRSGIVEPVFAQIKENQGFRRWTVKGIQNVQAQWDLLCTAYNLKKLHKHWLVKKYPRFRPFYPFLSAYPQKICPFVHLNS